MATVTIPKKITKGEELIVISRKDYEAFLRYQRGEVGLDKDFNESLKEYKLGKGYGPFRSVRSLVKVLKSRVK